MYKEKNNYYYVDEFSKNKVHAIFTKRNAGDFSDKALESLHENHIIKFLKNFKDTKNIFYAKQTHSANIKIIGENDVPGKLDNIDGFISKRKDIIIVLKYADCLPIFIMDKKLEIIAGLHSGWRGTYDGILNKAIQKMESEFKSQKDDILIALGVGIKKCCYEVGQDLYDKFSKKYSSKLLKGVFEKRNEKLYFDNEILNYNTLKNMGIEDKNIIRSNICTFCSNKFFSYRKEKENDARNAGMIMFENN